MGDSLAIEIPEGLKRANAETEISADFCDIACAAVNVSLA
jgi:hypothetical protein